MELRRRRLPHLYRIGRPVFVTFRLHGSLPAHRVFSGGATTSGHAFATMDRMPGEAGIGRRFLAMPSIAGAIAKAIQESPDYCLHAWVVMPNHVHMLVTFTESGAEALHRLKGSTARQANKLLHRIGVPFWQDESCDRLVRTEKEFERIVGYIENDPVRCGLAHTPEAHPWSSAGTKRS